MDGGLRPLASNPSTGLEAHGATRRTDFGGDSEDVFANVAGLRTPRRAEVLEEGVGGVNADQAEPRIFEIKNHVEGQGEGGDKKQDVKPAPAGGRGHLVAGQHGGNQG